MELNPILTRESRARWRRQAFLLLFFGVSLFAIIMYFCYRNAVMIYDWQDGDYVPVQQESSVVGAALFQQLTYYQVIGWMLLAPTLTATTIASERERGLLEGLQLSQLTPGAIVRGKLYSALTFAGLLLLSSMPVVALCFVLGGVSPGEFLGASVQTFLAILLGASIGLVVSARSRRASHAVGGTFGLAFLWGFGSTIALAFAAIPGLNADINTLLSASALLNPTLTMTMWWGDMPAMLPPFFTGAIEPWLLGWILQATLSAFLLWLCIGPVRRPFDEQYWVEIGPGTDVLELTAAQARHESKTGKKLKSRAPRGRWELPLAQRIKLKNPIMQRDLRAKFIFRRAGLWGLMWQSVVGLAAVGFYAVMLWLAFTDRNAGEFMFPAWTFVVALAMLLVPAIIGAGAFTREREAGTWEGIRLSLLSAWEIIIGKQIGAMALAPVASVVLLPFVIPFAIKTIDSQWWTYEHEWRHALMAFVFIFTLAWFSAAWGLRISWSSRKTASATAWTIGSLFIALVIAPAFLLWIIDTLSRSWVSSSVGDWFMPLHPLGCFMSLFLIDDSHKSPRALSEVMRGCLFFFGFGCLLLLSLWAQMKRGSHRD